MIVVERVKKSFAEVFIPLRAHKRIVQTVLFTLLIVIIGIAIGYKIRQSGVNYSNLKKVIRSATSLPKRYLNTILTNPEVLNIDIKYKNLQKLYYANDYALKYNHGILNTIDSSKGYVRMAISKNGNKIKGKARVKGNFTDSRSNDKLSLRIKLSGDGTYMGMKRFSIHDPNVKSNMSEWLFYRFLAYEEMISCRYDFIEVNINGNYSGIFAIEEHFDKRLIENNKLKEGVILKFDESNLMRSYYLLSDHQKRTQQFDYLSNSYSISPVEAYMKDDAPEDIQSQYNRARALLESFRNRKLSMSEVFDVEEFAKLFALSDLFGRHHNLEVRNLKYYYNPITSKIQPVGFDQHLPIAYLEHAIGENKRMDGNSNIWEDVFFQDKEFVSHYVKSLGRISEPSYLDNFITENMSDYNKALSTLQKDRILYSDNSVNILRENQQYIRRLLSPSKLLHVYSDSSEQEYSLTVGNIIPLPVKITGIRYSDINYYYNTPIILDSKINNSLIQYFDIQLPGVDMKDNISVDSMQVICSVYGSSGELNNEIYDKPLYSINEWDTDPLIGEYQNYETELMYINDSICIFKEDHVVLNKSITIPQGKELHIYPGTVIDLSNYSSIITNSRIVAIGTEDHPIKIISTDSTGEGIVAINVTNTSVFDYVVFDNLSRPSKNSWSLSGAITFYESDVEFYNCSFSHNIIGDDYLNIVRSEFIIQQSNFSNVNADAIDIDYGEGLIREVQFNDINNDAIDVSGSSVSIQNVIIDSALDKGISAGEGSRVDVSEVTISNTQIAFASKDESVLTLYNSSIKNCALGYAVFQKKSEYGPASIVANKINIISVRERYLLERGSTLIIEGKRIQSASKDVKQYLYGNEFGAPSGSK